MSKNFRNLYVFGDSYSTTDYCVPWRESFWGLAAQSLQVDCITNYSALGNSFDSVIYLCASESDNIVWGSDSLILICIPPLERITWHDMSTESEYFKTEITADGLVRELKVDGHRNLKCDPVHKVSPDMAKILERSWSETEGLTKSFLLYHYLESKNTPFVIVNMCFDYQRSGWPNSFFQDWFSSKDNVIMFHDTYASINVDVNKPVDYGQFGWIGHHGTAGNQRFFEKRLWPLLENYVKRLRS